MTDRGKSLRFAVLGHPIAHSLSPVMHNAAFAAMDLDATYTKHDVPPDRLLDALAEMAGEGYSGVNLTVPLKQVAFEGMADLDDSARLARAVNTVQFLEGGLRGHNTDGTGFLSAYVEAFGEQLAAKRIAILGTGGSARGVAVAVAAVSPGIVYLCGRDAARTRALADEVRSEFPAITFSEALTDDGGWERAIGDSDAVIHTTTVGMKPDDAPIVPASAFRPGQTAYDLIYVEQQTVFMRAASEGGARVANGLGMLLHQGVDALRIWLNREPAVDAMRDALTQAVYGV